MSNSANVMSKLLTTAVIVENPAGTVNMYLLSSIFCIQLGAQKLSVINTK